MDNHYHLLIETPSGGLGRGMRELNGVYTQGLNRRHGRMGHLLQGRFKAVLVDKDSYLLELSRYIVLNPVRARRAGTAGEWLWSSYQGVMGRAKAAPQLAVAKTLALFSAHDGAARRAFARFVAAGVDAEDPGGRVLNQVFLGNEAFVERVSAKLAAPSKEVPRRQRRRSTLSAIAAQEDGRDAAIRRAYSSGHFSLKEIGEHFGLLYATVSRNARG